MLKAGQLLKEQCIGMPAQVARASFSHETFTAIIEPPLTSVDQRCEQMGEAAVQLFLELVATPKATLVQRQVMLLLKLFVRVLSRRATEFPPAAAPLPQ